MQIKSLSEIPLHTQLDDYTKNKTKTQPTKQKTNQKIVSVGGNVKKLEPETLMAGA